MVVSSNIDSLKLIFSDDYEISGGDYKALSDILAREEISEIAFNSGLVQAIKLLFENDVRLPVSVKYLQDLWEENYISFNFVKMLVPLIKNNVIKLRKVGHDKFFSDDNITKNVSLEDSESEKYVVIYPTSTFRDVYDVFKDILSKYTKLDSVISEGVQIVPVKVDKIALKATKSLQSFGMRVNVESYMKDDTNNAEEINFIVSGTSDYTLKDKDVQRIAKKILNKVSYVKDVEAYKESSSELFIGVTVDMQSSYTELSNKFYALMSELESESVS